MSTLTKEIQDLDLIATKAIDLVKSLHSVLDEKLTHDEKSNLPGDIKAALGTSPLYYPAQSRGQ
jgi:hypothetical protein